MFQIINRNDKAAYVIERVIQNWVNLRNNHVLNKKYISL